MSSTSIANITPAMGELNMAELLVVRSKIKDCTDLNVSGDFGEALSEKVRILVGEAEKRAKANGRKTLKPSDL